MDSTVDTSTRPLVGLHFGREPSLETFNEVFDMLLDELNRHRSICLLVDAQRTSRLDLAHVRRIAEFGQQNQNMLGAYVRALALVVPSAMVRGALKVAFQIKVPPHPVRICQTEEEARSFLAPFLDMLRPA